MFSCQEFSWCLLQNVINDLECWRDELTSHLFYCQPGKNESWQKTYKFTLIAEKLFWTLPVTKSRYCYSWKIMHINRYGKRVPERLPSRLPKIYCKEYVLTQFLLLASLSYVILLQPPNEHRVVFSLHLETYQHTPLQPKQIQHISGNRGRFSNMSGLCSSTAFNPRESTSSIWSLMILLKGQITKTQPFDETESIDLTIANTWTIRTLYCYVLLFLKMNFSQRFWRQKWDGLM